MPENEATWENLADIMAFYPFLNLKDKVDFNWGGIVTGENDTRTNVDTLAK